MTKSSNQSKGMTIYERLTNAQNELKAPKNQYNGFGKYKYRSAEDILEAVKPINQKHGLNLYIKDYIEEIGGRIYVKALAVLSDYEGNCIESWAYAREEENKKGMDGSQVTGASSSYARKYALNGLYLIDDTKDADTDEYHLRTNSVKTPTKQNIQQNTQQNIQQNTQQNTNINIKEELIKNINNNINPASIMKWLEMRGFNTLNDVATEDLQLLWKSYIQKLEETKKK